ncbi:SDR family oxidoreductase [Rosenbergiella australiborealis]|uniref:SDR family oxidoreductase n=1 Tax=Rosenbergiella australiborealis TaxID=1544696 RepID=A0ABS5T238_9GAMM|nr:SDR family oxidoreductase [Rosenbergiella australiborealis]MBT0726419.1 SDR family oxidoreductase [Rosenbergiella australiborealis]
MSQQRPIAIVTGGSQGIGLAIVETLLAAHYVVVIADLQPPAEHAKITQPTSVMYQQCDVSDEKSVEELVIKTVAQYGRIDVVINNAGIVCQGELTSLSQKTWQRVFKINVEGPFLLCRAVLPIMQQQQHGRIVNIASVAAQTGGGFLGNTCYASSKGAVISLSKGIAREYGSQGITCNTLCPGYVETPLTEAMSEAQVEYAVNAIPAKRPGKPSDIAEAILLLVSEKNSYINGVTLNVDGGLIRY